MQTRTLGSDFAVSAMGLGCMNMTSYYDRGDENGAIATIHRAIDLGVTLFDTADMYGPYVNEELLGRALKGRRDEVHIATKFGIIIDPTDSTNMRRTFDATPAHMRKSIEGSLRRLGTEYVDMYYLHRIDDKTPIDQTIAAMADLVREGKVRYLGLSEAGAQTLRRAHAVHPITALQSEYSLFARDIEPQILPVIRELGIGLVAYSPLGRGILTGAITNTESLREDDYRRNIPRYGKGNFEQNMYLVEKLGQFAKSRGCTTSQLALSWVLAQGEDVVPIPGTSKVANLESNVAALDVRLSDDDVEELRDMIHPDAVAGERAPNMAVVNREAVQSCD